MSSRGRHLLLLGMGLLAAIGCAAFERGERLPDAAPGPMADGGAVLTFERDIEPLLTLYCGSCHGPQGSASNTGFMFVGDVDADYDNVFRFLDLDEPSSSRLLAKGRGEGHGGGVSLSPTNDDYRVIFDWIAQGARP